VPPLLGLGRGRGEGEGEGEGEGDPPPPELKAGFMFAGPQCGYFFPTWNSPFGSGVLENQQWADPGSMAQPTFLILPFHIPPSTITALWALLRFQAFSAAPGGPDPPMEISKACLGALEPQHFAIS